MTARSARLIALAGIATLGSAAQASGPRVQIVPPHHRDPLPVFGMHTYNDGHGEHVVRVHYGGLAWRMGIEPGDTIVRLNHQRLHYHGSWEHALRRAMRHGGHVDLAIVDVRTGGLARRHVDLHSPWGGGPITPKAAPVARHGSGYLDQPRHEFEPPITIKSHEEAPQVHVTNRLLGGLREALRRD